MGQDLHSGETIADVSKKAVKNAGIPADKVVALVHDEAANMESAGGLLHDDVGRFSEACAAHRLHMALTHALGEIQAIRDLLERSRQIVGHFKCSAKATEALTLRQKQLNIRALEAQAGLPYTMEQFIPDAKLFAGDEARRHRGTRK